MRNVGYKHSTLGKYKWATSEFSIKNITSTITEDELKNGLSPGSTSSFIFKRCYEIDALTPKERESGEHYRQSAKLVAEKDSNADVENIASVLEKVVDEYFQQARKMFGV